MDASANRKIWNLIKNQHTAVLVTVAEDGSLDSRPMGCLQEDFDGTLCFMTFKDTPKLLEIGENRHVLVSYARPGNYEFVSVSGRARMVDSPAEIHRLWNEGLRVWFPKGPESPDIALLAVDVDLVRTWTKPASALTYAYYYLKARITGKSPSPGQIALQETFRD